MTLDDALGIWIFGTIVVAFFSGIASLMLTLEIDPKHYSARTDARNALKAYAVFFLSWSWPLVVPILLGRKVLSVFEVAELETPLDKWRERQSLKIVQLEEDKRILKMKDVANILRIEELEVEVGLRKEVSDETRALAARWL